MSGANVVGGIADAARAATGSVSSAAGGAKRRVGRFGQRLGIPGIGRKPQKQELEVLQGRVAAFQPDPEAARLAGLLTASLAKLYAKDDREASIAEATATAATVRAGLKALAERQGQAAQAAKAATPAKADQMAEDRARTDLHAALARSRAAIPDDLADVRLPPGRTRQALLAEAEAIAQDIGAGSLMADGRRAALDGRVAQLDADVQAAVRRRQQVKAYVDGPAAAQLAAAQALLAQCDRDVGGTYDGPLRRVTETLAVARTGVPVDEGLLRQLAAEAGQIAATIRADGAYVLRTQAEAAGRRNAAATAQWCERSLAPMQSDLSDLAASGSPRAPPVLERVAALRASAGQVVAAGQEGAAMDRLALEIEAVTQQVAALRRDIRQSVEVDGLAVRQGLQTARQDRGTRHAELGATPVLATDWKAVDAQLGAAEAIIPASGALPETLDAQDVALARSLLQAATVALAGMQADSAGLLAFDKEAEELAAKVKERGVLALLKRHDKSQLEALDPKLRADLDGRLAALVKALPRTPAAESRAALDALKAEAQDAFDTLATVAAYLDGTAKPLMAAMKQEQKDWKHGGAPAPRAYAAALDALEEKAGAQPPVLADLVLAVAAATDARNLTPEQRTAAIRTDKEAERTAAAEAKTKAATAQALLRPVKGQLSAARQAVALAGGDKAALAACQHLLERIEADIGAKVFDGVDVKRTDLQARLDDLLANPMGGRNQRRAELPAVLGRLRAAVGAAQAALGGAADEVDAHQPANDAERGAQGAVPPLLRQYAQRLGNKLNALEAASQLVNDPTAGDGTRRKAREDSLAVLRQVQDRLKAEPMTAELLRAPFPAVRAGIAPVLQALGAVEYTLATCI